jgi:hypothetical protein
MTRGLVTDQRVAKILDTNPTAVDQSTAEAELRPLSIMPLASRLRDGALRPQQIMIEFANGLDRFLQLLVIAQPQAHFSNPLATHAELARPSSWIGHRQNKHPMPFAARTICTILAVSDRALFLTASRATTHP